MIHAFRLTKGQDLKKEIESYAIDNKLSGVILSSVGCLTRFVVRLADGESILTRDGHFEIVSIMGTVSKDGVHIHISVSDEEGNTIGGHLKDGCIVNTTAEVVLQSFDEYEFSREFDNSTGYKELVIKKKETK